jgi:hypothetical protein
MDLGLQGKVVIITGSSDGLGAAAARTLSSEGASVVICARNLEKLQTVAAGIGQNVLAVQTDVTKPEHLEHLVARTMERFGRIDALVNNAGRAAALPFEKIDDAAWHDDALECLQGGRNGIDEGDEQGPGHGQHSCQRGVDRIGGIGSMGATQPDDGCAAGTDLRQPAQGRRDSAWAGRAFSGVRGFHRVSGVATRGVPVRMRDQLRWWHEHRCLTRFNARVGFVADGHTRAV